MTSEHTDPELVAALDDDEDPDTSCGEYLELDPADDDVEDDELDPVRPDLTADEDQDQDEDEAAVELVLDVEPAQGGPDA